MKLKTTSTLGAALVAALALTSAANAAFIKGEIAVGALSTAAIDFGANTVSFTPTAPLINAIVSNSTQDFATLAPVMTFGSYKNFTYDPLTVSNPVWSFGGVSFSLLNISSISESASSLVLFGSGNALAAGFDDTPGTWSFSADKTGSSFSWSSTAAVPDGGTTIALLGVSLLGLHGIRRRLSK